MEKCKLVGGSTSRESLCVCPCPGDNIDLSNSIPAPSLRRIPAQFIWKSASCACLLRSSGLLRRRRLRIVENSGADVHSLCLLLEVDYLADTRSECASSAKFQAGGKCDKNLGMIKQIKSNAFYRALMCSRLMPAKTKMYDDSRAGPAIRTATKSSAPGPIRTGRRRDTGRRGKCRTCASAGGTLRRSSQQSY